MKNFITGISLLITINSCQTETMAQSAIRYVALGDSYTIGTGAKESENWPSVLTKQLKENKIDIDLIANPSVNGRTTYGVIESGLPVFDKSNATFVTLLIGVNDWIQGVDTAEFRENLSYIINHVQSKLPDKSKMVLITIPDFSVTPSGKNYSRGRDVAKGLSEFNAIILSEAKKHNLKTADLYEISKKMKDNPDWIANDGLHPSAKGYTVWESQIYPVVYSLLK
jgi:acyl-CoA thioesterase-1